MILDSASAVLVLAGSLFALTAGLGVLRFPDTLARLHAASKPSGLGLLLMGTGAALQLDLGSAAKLAAAVILAFATIPVGSHVIGDAAEEPDPDPDGVG